MSRTAILLTAALAAFAATAAPAAALSRAAAPWFPGGQKGDGQGEEQGEKKDQDTAADKQDGKPEKQEVEHWTLPPEPGMKTTESGLKWKVLKEGRGDERPRLGARCTVKFKAWTPDGKVFDDWKKTGKPAEVEIGRSMPGWDEAIQLMTPGMKLRAHIPYDLAFGEKGRREIPGKTDIGVEFHLIKFTPGPKLPPFTPVDPDKQTRLASGVKYEVIERGEGEVARPLIDQVDVAFDGYTLDGRIFLTSVVNGRMRMKGSVNDLGPIVGDDLSHLLRKGAVILTEIPPGMIGGGHRINALAPGAKCIMRFRVRNVVRREPPEGEPMKLKGGIKCWIVREGTGRGVGPNSNVTTMEATWIKRGGLIDSSYKRGGPIDYGLRMITKGKRRALRSMRVGAICYFEVPYALLEGGPGMDSLAKGTSIIYYIELRGVRDR